jgi:endonuclease/exonuclease/phosphatase family metal-dependent hydrolase
MGDLNDTPGSLMYDVLASAGFTDAWAALRQSETGNSCCHLADLSNPVTDFSQRIDYVFARGGQRRAGELSGEIERFGVSPSDRLAGPAYPIWPSDHAGLVATLQR